MDGSLRLLLARSIQPAKIPSPTSAGTPTPIPTPMPAFEADDRAVAGWIRPPETAPVGDGEELMLLEVLAVSVTITVVVSPRKVVVSTVMSVVMVIATVVVAAAGSADVVLGRLTELAFVMLK